MAERVAVVQHGTQAGRFKFVAFDDICLQAAASGDDVSQHVGPSRMNGFHMVFEIREELGVEDHAVLHHFGQSRAVLTIGQRLQHGGVDEDTDRLVKGPDHVLGERVIDPSLASH